ncbi:MAG TPA: sigma-70 family RNA polymerase sigma factor [Acidimicrobiales bacterium]|jgi:RNA polymerase sigma-70 factor (ECF subfamily)
MSSDPTAARNIEFVSDNRATSATILRGLNVEGERELIERARCGEQRAWEALFRRTYPKLLSYAARRLPTQDLAKDAVGETMTRAVASIDRFRSEGGGFDAWIYGIARHVVLDTQRTMWREGPGLVPDVTDVAGLQPGDPVLRRDDTTAVRSAFSQLSRADQELLELRVVAGLSAEEVGYVLGRRPGAVRMAQSRALDRLRAILGECGGDHE